MSQGSTSSQRPRQVNSFVRRAITKPSDGGSQGLGGTASLVTAACDWWRQARRVWAVMADQGEVLMADASNEPSGGKVFSLPHEFAGQVRLATLPDEFPWYGFCLLDSAGQVLQTIKLPMSPSYYSIED